MDREHAWGGDILIRTAERTIWSLRAGSPKYWQTRLGDAAIRRRSRRWWWWRRKKNGEDWERE